MPELPEVEHAARSLRRWFSGRIIERAAAPESRIFRGSDRLAFQRKLRGRTLEWVERRGKYLLIAFDDDVGLLSHLGMTGKWVKRARDAPAPLHGRARLALEDDDVVFYDDPRLFGRLAIHPASELLELPEIRALGPDPLVDGIDRGQLHASLRKTSRSVKVALMDQGVIAGLGNIQTTEALFRAKIHPARVAHTLSSKEVDALVEAIAKTIEITLAEAGIEEITYIEERGSHNPFLVYRRGGEPCPRCGTTLESIVLGGRSTVFCPKCQKL